MLVLSRKKNESIVINDDITIVIVEIRGDKVRLGVEAPHGRVEVGPRGAEEGAEVGELSRRRARDPVGHREGRVGRHPDGGVGP